MDNIARAESPDLARVIESGMVTDEARASGIESVIEDLRQAGFGMEAEVSFTSSTITA